MWTKSLIFWLYCLVTCVWTSNEQYSGDKVVSIKLPMKEDYDKISKYFKDHSAVEVWSQTKEECEVQIKNNTLETLKQYCKNENLTIKVEIDDVKVVIDREAILNGLPSINGSFNYSRYNRYEDIKKELFRLQSHYPFLMKIYPVGTSFENRTLLLIKISENITNDRDGDKKPIIWIDGGMHAREWISVAAPMYMIRELLQKYRQSSQIKSALRNNMFYFVPVFNPDGYEYSFVTERLWRKTRTTHPNSTCRGADPNRNFRVMWSKFGASSEPCEPTYHGVAPESEPCVAAYADILRWKQPLLKSYWSLHSFFQILLIPNSYTLTLPSDITNISKVFLRFLSAIVKRFNTSYGVFQSASVVGPIGGASLDYVHDNLTVSYSYAIELPPVNAAQGGFALPPDKIVPTSLETLDAILESNEEIDQILAAEN